MRPHRPTTIGLALIGSIVLLLLPARPAAASVHLFEFRAGSFVLWEVFGGSSLTFDMEPLSYDFYCAQANTFDHSGTTSSGDADISINTTFENLATDYIVTLTSSGTVAGTYDGSPDPYDLHADDLTLTATFKELSPSTFCQPISGVVCTITATGVDLLSGSQVDTATNAMTSAANGDVGSFVAANTDFETTVSGSDCGSLIAFDNGSVVLDADWELTS